MQTPSPPPIVPPPIVAPQPQPDASEAAVLDQVRRLVQGQPDAPAVEDLRQEMREKLDPRGGVASIFGWFGGQWP
jgi:hypothetical protein